MDLTPQGTPEKKIEKQKKKFFTRKKILFLLALPLFLGLLTVLFNTALLWYPTSFEAQNLPSQGDLRVMTFNIAHSRGLALFSLFHTEKISKRNLDNIASLLKHYQPQIVALQEVDQDSNWNGNFDHLEYLAKKSGYSHFVWGVNVDVNGWYKLKYGNGLLSKTPLQDVEAVAFGEKAFMQKGFIYGVMEVKKKKIPLITLHLDFKRASNRAEEMDQLKKFWKKKKEKNPSLSNPLILGDFNASSEEEAFQSFATDLSYSAIYPQKGYTFSTYWPNKRIDHIFLPSYLEAQNCYILESYLSDHFPVMMDLKIK